MRLKWSAVAVAFPVVAAVLGGAVWMGTLQGQIRALSPETAAKLERRYEMSLANARVTFASSFERLIPVGTVLAFHGNTDRLPKHWRLCDGSELDNELYAGAHYEKVPDLRGRFVRGAMQGHGEYRTEGGVDRHRQSGHHHNSGTLNAQRGTRLTRPRIVSPLRSDVTTGYDWEAEIDVRGRTSDGGGFNLDNRPTHINLHYIIKVCDPSPEQAEVRVCRQAQGP